MEVKRREVREFVEGGVLWVHLFIVMGTAAVAVAVGVMERERRKKDCLVTEKIVAVVITYTPV